MPTQREQTWDLLAEALREIEYKREPPPTDRRFELVREDADNYAVLYIFTYNPNTYDESRMRWTRHNKLVPVCTYHKQQWIRWVLERIISIELHETVENFFVNGDRIFAPYHGNGWDPYSLLRVGDPVERAKAPGQN